MVVTLQLQSVILSKENGVAVATLNEPDKMNRLTPGIRGGLMEALENVAQDNEIRVMVITGSGRGFCTGGDVTSFPDIATGKRPPLWSRGGSSPVAGIRHLDKPVIAAVNGYAVGAGMNMALACDMRIASEEARFSEVFVRRGLLPDAGGTWSITRAVSLAKACELVFTADFIDGREAERIGLVNKTVPHEELMPAALELAGRVAKNAPLALRASKRALYDALFTRFEEAHANELYLQDLLFKTEDGLEGSKAFLEKREPIWKGR